MKSTTIAKNNIIDNNVDNDDYKDDNGEKHY